MKAINWKSALLGLFLLAWAAQVIWLGGHFFPEAKDLVLRLGRGDTGDAIRQEDPFYRWLMALARVMPRRSAYIFLDRYEAGKDIEARYHLYPRRLTLGSPQIPPAYLFYLLRQNDASFVLVRRPEQPPGPGLEAALTSPAFTRLNFPGPGLALRVNLSRLYGDFYD